MKRDKGFTLIEIAIAISIFGILMLSFSQLLRNEIRLYNTVSENTKLEEKARATMMRILDEIRITPYTMYSSDSTGLNGGVYQNPPGSKSVLINANPDSAILSALQSNPSGVSPGIYYQPVQGELWYCDGAKIYLIADQVYRFEIIPASADQKHFIKISLGLGNSGGEHYDLITWARLY